MKNSIQDLFKKNRYKEKQIFLFCNAILLVVVMASVWLSFTSNNSENTIANFETSGINATVPTTEIPDIQATEETVALVETTIPNTEKVTIPPETTTIPMEPENPYPLKHIIKQGDSWYSLSEKYFSTNDYAAAIAYTNDRSITDYAFVGETIIIESEYSLINAMSEINSIDEPNEYNEVHTFLKGKYGYSYGTRPNPAIDITVDKNCTGKNYTGKVDTSNFEFIGNHVITAYDPYCTHCCSGTGIMASGVHAINGYSVAAEYPIGTTLYIEGYGFYVVEDRGVTGKHIDIAAPSHEACGPLTKSSVAVYIVPNNNQ